jgi:aminopeptidase N
VVPNARGESFVRVRLDVRSAAAVATHLADVEDDLVRAVLWAGQLDRTETGDLDADTYLELVARHLPRETDPTVVAGVVHHALGRVVPLRVPADAAGAAVRRLAAACRAGLDRDPAEQTAIAFAEGLVATSDDPDLLRTWLAEGRTDAGTALDPRLRWRALARLAQLGAADEEEIAAARTADGSAEAELGAARALAARPTAAAKEAAWLAMTDDQVSNRMFSALAEGLWSAEHAELVAPYVAAYAERGPALAARSSAFANVVGWAFPGLALDADQVARFESALRGDVPTLLRRAWEDELDDRR